MAAATDPPFPTPPSLGTFLTYGLSLELDNEDRSAFKMLEALWHAQASYLNNGTLSLPDNEKETLLSVFFEHIGTLRQDEKEGGYLQCPFADLDSVAAHLVKALSVCGATLPTEKDLKEGLEITLHVGWPRTHAVLLSLPGQQETLRTAARDDTWKRQILARCFRWNRRDYLARNVQPLTWREGSNEDAWAVLLEVWKQKGCVWAPLFDNTHDTPLLLKHCCALPVLDTLLQSDVHRPQLKIEQSPPDFWRREYAANHADALIRRWKEAVKRTEKPASEEQRFDEVGKRFMGCMDKKTAIASLLRQYGFTQRLSYSQAAQLLDLFNTRMHQEAQTLMPHSNNEVLATWTAVHTALKQTIPSACHISVPKLSLAGTPFRDFCITLLTQTPGFYLGTPLHSTVPHNAPHTSVVALLFKPFFTAPLETLDKDTLRSVVRCTSLLALNPHSNRSDRAPFRGYCEEHAVKIHELLTHFWLEGEKSTLAEQGFSKETSTLFSQALQIWDNIGRAVHDNTYGPDQAPLTHALQQKALFEAWLQSYILGRERGAFSVHHQQACGNALSFEECTTHLLALAHAEEEGRFCEKKAQRHDLFRQVWCATWGENIPLRRPRLRENAVVLCVEESGAEDLSSSTAPCEYDASIDIFALLKAIPITAPQTFWTVWRFLYIEALLDSTHDIRQGLQGLVRDQHLLSGTVTEQRQGIEEALHDVHLSLFEDFKNRETVPQPNMEGIESRERTPHPLPLKLEGGRFHVAPVTLYIKEDVLCDMRQLVQEAIQRLDQGSVPSEAWCDEVPLLKQPGSPLSPLMAHVIAHALDHGGATPQNRGQRRRV